MSASSEGTPLWGPTMSRHAEGRWGQRGDGRPQSEALAISVKVDLTRPGGQRAYPKADEVRLYRSGQMDRPLAFIIREGCVTTVKPASRTDLAPPTLKKCSACGGVHEIVFENECIYCNPDLQGLNGGL